MSKEDYMVIFWGVRGSRPVPGPNTVRYGGNTPCVQIQIGSHLLILDAGTGICNLGRHLEKQFGHIPIKGDIFITHTHWDHIQGLPFFVPSFKKGNSFALYGQGKMNQAFEALMKGQMVYPHFPVQFEDMGATIEFHEVEAGQEIILPDDIRITTYQNNHPSGSISYRIEHQGRVCCYVTDLEHTPEIDLKLIEFVQFADLVIYDANYTDEEYLGIGGMLNRIGWGHSTWQEGIKLVKVAKAKKLILFHHDSNRTDEELAKIEKQAQQIYGDCQVAQEGMVIHL